MGVSVHTRGVAVTVELSRPRVRRLLKGYFAGLPQPLIAGRLGISQASVSNWTARFRSEASANGLLETAEVYGMSDEVSELRSLAVELNQADLTVSDAREGVGIIKKFSGLGIKAEQHAVLIKVCGEVDDPGFIHAALKLGTIEQSSHLGYAEVLTKYENIASQLAGAEKQFKVTQAALKSASNALAGKKQELAAVNSQLEASQKNAKAEEQALEQQLAIKKKKLDVQGQEVDELAKLKAELAKQGLDIPTLIKLAKEFSDEHGKH